MPDLDPVRGQIRFFLNELSTRNEHHGFERLCGEVVRKRICANVVPATGPVSSGGDHGRDLETFKTYLEASPLRDSAFLGTASEGVLVFACSTEKEPQKGKIRSDVDKIMERGEAPERVYFLSADNVPVGKRHDVQDEVWEKHKVRLEVFDAQWLAEQLAERDLYWVAVKYLNMPSDIYPALPMASAALGALATDLASATVLKAAGRLGEAAFGPPQKRALKELLGESIRALLDGLTRSGELGEDPDYVSGLRVRLSNFFATEEVADALVSVAVDSEPLPVSRLREVYEGRGYDPGAFPVTFERAMETCALHLARRVREEAAAPAHPLHNLVSISKLYGLEQSIRELFRRTEPTGPSADELERASWTRCRRRWTTLGVAPDEEESLARNPTVGAPGPDVRERLGRPVSVIAAEAESGKSLLLDRLMQRAIARYRDEEGAPLPVFIDATRVRGELREAVVHGTRSLGRPEEVGAAVFLDGLEEAGRSEAGRLLEEAHYLPDAWPDTTVVVAGRPLQELEEEKEHGDPIELPELTATETGSLIRRFSGNDRVLDAILHGLPESVRKAVRRPLFATLVGLNMRNNYGRDARSVGGLLSHLVERALKKSGEAVELKELRDLAVAVTDSASGRVRARDVGTWPQIGRMRATGLVQEMDGTLRFSLQILAEWFAAQALELGEVEAEELASDFGRLERWRYPLVMAASNFGYERASRIFGPVVRAAPPLPRR